MKNLNYDILKAIGQVIAPAVITCIITILKVLDIPNTDVVEVIMMALLTCYNSIIVVWNSNYYKDLANNIEEVEECERG